MEREDNDVGTQAVSEDVFCPYINKPRPECYCINMNERKINLVVRFCLKDYKNCRIHHKIYLRETRMARS